MSISQRLNQIFASTIERPTILEADAAARYSFAKKYCKNKTVLDLGCGVGIGTAFIAENGAKKVLGVDYSESAIKIAGASQQFKKNKNISFMVGNGLELEKIHKKFDVIIAFEIVEHLPVNLVDEFLKQLHRKLNPNGVLLLSTPNELHTKYFLGKPHNPFHIKEYKLEEITQYIKHYFSHVTSYGIRCINEEHKKNREIIEKRFMYKISYVVGHFKFIRNILGFIPKGVKGNVTKENTLSSLSAKDYTTDKNIKESEGLFIIAKY